MLNTMLPPTNCTIIDIYHRETLDGCEVVIDITDNGEAIAAWMHNSAMIGWADVRTMLDWMDNVLPLSTFLEIDPGDPALSY